LTVCIQNIGFRAVLMPPDAYTATGIYSHVFFSSYLKSRLSLKYEHLAICNIWLCCHLRCCCFCVKGNRFKSHTNAWQGHYGLEQHTEPISALCERVCIE